MDPDEFMRMAPLIDALPDEETKWRVRVERFAKEQIQDQERINVTKGFRLGWPRWKKLQPLGMMDFKSKPFEMKDLRAIVPDRVEIFGAERNDVFAPKVTPAWKGICIPTFAFVYV